MGMSLLYRSRALTFRASYPYVKLVLAGKKRPVYAAAHSTQGAQASSGLCTSRWTCTFAGMVCTASIDIFTRHEIPQTDDAELPSLQRDARFSRGYRWTLHSWSIRAACMYWDV
jgi:hypothetical protein